MNVDKPLPSSSAAQTAQPSDGSSSPRQATALQALAGSATVPPISGLTHEQLLGELRKLPLFPAAAQQAMALAADVQASVQELSRLIESDVTLAASMLRLANSPLYNWGPPIESLHQCIVRLGMRECRNLIVAISMHNVFHKTDPVTLGYCTILWDHSYLTGCLCRRLNKMLSLGFQGEEFTAGLLHDLGRILFAVTMPGLFRTIDALDFQESEATLEHESTVLGTDHSRIGSHYSEQNGLPEATVAAVRYHHQVEQRPIIGDWLRWSPLRTTWRTSFAEERRRTLTILVSTPGFSGSARTCPKIARTDSPI